MTDTSIVALPGRVTPTRTGLIFSNGISYEEWEQLGCKLNNIEGAVHWWIGDWLNFGEAKWGEMYSQALNETGYKYDQLRADKWVSGSYQLCERSHKLSWSHHHRIADIENDDRQFLMKRAEDGIRDRCLSRGLGDVYKRQVLSVRTCGRWQQSWRGVPAI